MLPVRHSILNMRRRLLLFIIVTGIVAVAALVLWFAPKAQEASTLRLARAWVGVEVGGGGLARTGTVRLVAGESFRLHAVVEAHRGGDGEAVYYSATPRVELDGQEVDALPVEELSVLGRVRLLWFSVENGLPFREMENGADLESFRYEQFFRPEWGSAWSIDGALDAYFDSWVENDVPAIERDFGTLRYQVWVETSLDEDALVPDQRVKSASLPDATRVEARLPEALGVPSAVFGLPGIVRGDGDWDAAALARLQGLHRDRLAFSRVTLLQELLHAGGVGWGDLNWQLTPLDGSVPWRDAKVGMPAPGDLVRVADRWVVLLGDETGVGEPGMLDGADLCLDFAAGASVRRLDQIFLLGSEEGGDVQVASPRPPV